MKIKSVTIRAALIAAGTTLLVAIGGGVYAWVQHEEIRNDNFRLAALPLCIEANQGYRQISAKWFTSQGNLEAINGIAAELRSWHATHDLYLTSEGRRIYNVLIGAIRHAADPKIDPAERQQRTQTAAQLIWPFREALLSGAWFASASRDPQSVRVLGE
jgi:hypothetical protein